MRCCLVACLGLILSFGSSIAQHGHDGNQADTTRQTDTVGSSQKGQHTPDSHGAGEMTAHGGMESAMFFGAPMNRDGSGTSWLPDNSPMFAIHRELGDWALMVHGNQFVRYSYQNINNRSKRGEDELTAPNWVMAMAHRPVGARGKFMGRLMMSLDRLSEGGNGYPLLLQSGESWEGEPLIDLQHPHDLFSEVAVSYAHELTDKVALFGYVGYPGEPAFGPPAFMHRPSALHNPDAPLSHHWQDATHILFGVATLGVQAGIAKLDGSVFTGREPDENRWDFDKPRFDSYSIRGTVNPLPAASVQVSWAFLKEPEVLEPGVDQRRTTASVIYAVPFGRNIEFTASLVWGLNDASDFEPQHSFLNESELRIHNTTLYNRWEFVQKSTHELGLEEELGERLFDVWQITGGVSQKLFTVGEFDFAAGAHLTANILQEALKPYYGDTPLSVSVQLRFSPALMSVTDHGM